MQIVETVTGWDGIKFESRSELGALLEIMQSGGIVDDDMRATGKFRDTDSGKAAEQFCSLLGRLWFNW